MRISVSNVTLSVPCYRTRVRVITFLPVFPWRVTYLTIGIEKIVIISLHGTIYINDNLKEEVRDGGRCEINDCVSCEGSLPLFGKAK